MKRRRISIAQENAQRIAAKCGSGTGSEYKTWITVHDFRSVGTRVRARFARSGRFLHLLSYLEFQHYMCIGADRHVVDIQEQYPLLPLEKTLEIAERLGFEHPGFRIGDHPTVMTTDLVATRCVNGKLTRAAYNIKPYSKTRSVQFKQKFAIEEAYWAEERDPVPLFSRTDKDLSYEFVRSADWIYQATWPFFIDEISYKHRLEIAHHIEKTCREKDDIISFIADEIDAKLNLEPGSAIDVVRWMLAENLWAPEPNSYPFPDRPLRLIQS